MRTSDFDYHLPPELIAQTPVDPRDSSRLLVLNRSTGRIEHRHFYEILDYLRPGDVMVFNESRVIPARLRGHREDTGGKVELLLLKEQSPGIWQALAQPGRRLRPGARVILVPMGDTPPMSPPYEGGVSYADILESHDDGIKTVRLEPEASIGQLGEMPLPPYIHQRLQDPERYQTVYAKQLGSAAAPTAGLHFTEELMARINAAGVELAFVTLHVGLDTFRPVQSEDPTKHKIHTEYFVLGPAAAAAINNARKEGRRIIAVGTTTVRVLEQAAQLASENGEMNLTPATAQAGLFILPGHRFLAVDIMVTNFHLPRSTLLMLVSAFADRDRVLEAYREAIAERYRFYSFGDAMLIA